MSEAQQACIVYLDSLKAFVALRHGQLLEASGRSLWTSEKDLHRALQAIGIEASSLAISTAPR